jgi:hypothetical protein
MPNVTLTRRARVERTELTTRRYWRTLDGRAELVQVDWIHPLAYGRYWLIVIKSPRLIIERRRTKQAAMRSLAAKLNPLSRSKR